VLPAPVLVAQYPTMAVWTWNYTNPFRWNAYLSLNNGATYQFDDFVYGDARQYSPDGGSSLLLIVGVDATGKEITHRSNAVRPDDAIAPPEIVGGNYEWEATDPAWWDVWIDWNFNHAGHPVAQMEVWLSINGGPFELRDTIGSDAPGYYINNAADSEMMFDFKVRYRNGATVGPFSNVYQINIQV
jgi:hypothetical protein